jgi:chemotaxis protein methyltransferase CheR
MIRHDPQLASAATEIPYGTADFEAISAMVHAHAGICLPEGKAMLVYSRLSKLVRESGLSSFADYVALIRKETGERGRAIEALTTNHTKFFREDHHFHHFEQDVRPEMLARLQRGERVRMWSSASSSGEEIYSLAMVLLGADRASGRRILQSDLALLATDLSEQVIGVGMEGRYPAMIAADIPQKYRDAWTTAQGDNVQIAKEVRDLVRFRKLNLLNPWPIKGLFDVIFCRNVMIYFDEPTKELLLRRLADQLAPGGYLYIGHSERLLGDTVSRFASIGQTIYRKVR